MVFGKGTGKMERFQGEYTYMTNSKSLGWLNSTKAWAEGTSNMRSNEANIKVYALKPIVEAPMPM